jgi:diguanylate cyclase (GGDEF)-like protein/PAS domain S-box-containing protein
MPIIQRLQKLSPVWLLLLSVAFSVAGAEVIVCGMELLLKGEVTYDYLLTGFVTSLCIAALVTAALIFFLDQQRHATERVEEQSAELSEKNFSLLQKQQFLDDIINSLGGIFYMLDDQGRFIRWNVEFERVTGYSAVELARMQALDFFGEKDKALIEEKMREVFEKGESSTEAGLVIKDGCKLPYYFSGRRTAIGEIFYLVGIGLDIAERKRAEEKLHHLAHYDVLTGLPNRTLFLDRLEREIKKSNRSGLALTLLYIDLDQFKEVNDTLGHHVGDALLVDAARRIVACVRVSDTVARLGGDEFTVILEELSDSSRVERVAQDVIKTLTEPFQVGGETVYVSASIGITIYPTDAADAESLLKNADQAMYVAKNSGRNRFSYFTSLLQEKALARSQLVKDLRGALAAGQFKVYFQPIVELATGMACKAEALIRWQHPERGMVSPAEFIPLAEETGLINEIGDWVFRESVHWVKRWNELCPHGFQVSVNKSPVQFISEIHQDDWLDYLHELGLPGQCVTIEITEGLLLNAASGVTDKLLRFRDAGIQVSIDDFGTGYSALSYLKKFDIDYLKIDQSFVRNLVTDPSDLALSEAIIVMAHKLGLKVIAEGVETLEQRKLLTAAGCDYGQGYLFSKAVPPEEFEVLLRAATSYYPESGS